MSRGLAQNFAGRHALIVSDGDLAPLTNALARTGVKSTQVSVSTRVTGDVIDVLRPNLDILIIDADGPAARGMTPQDMRLLAQIPILGLIEGESPSRLKILMRLGATALIRKPIYGASIYPALFLAVNQHRRVSSLESEVLELERRRRGRRAVMKAVMHRMMAEGLDDDTAYEDLRRQAMAARVPLEDYCEALALGSDRLMARDWVTLPALLEAGRDPAARENRCDPDPQGQAAGAIISF